MEKEEKKSEYDLMIRCFNTVILYNGYSDFFIDVYKLFQEYMKKWWAKKHELSFSIREQIRDKEINPFVLWQIQALRMMLVEMFGEYWTSPRSWWITDEKWFDKFMSDLIKDLSE